MDFTEIECQIVGLSRLQIALQKVKEADSLEQAKKIASDFLAEDTVARHRKFEG